MSDMSPPPVIAAEGAVEGEEILEALGYQPTLRRSLSVIGTVALTVSDITPTASLLVIGPAVITDLREKPQGFIKGVLDIPGAPQAAATHGQAMGVDGTAGSPAPRP